MLKNEKYPWLMRSVSEITALNLRAVPAQTSPKQFRYDPGHLSGFRRREEESLEILPPMIASPATIDAPYP